VFGVECLIEGFAKLRVFGEDAREGCEVFSGSGIADKRVGDSGVRVRWVVGGRLGRCREF
jgi:hypothetical protein